MWLTNNFSWIDSTDKDRCSFESWFSFNHNKFSTLMFLGGSFFTTIAFLGVLMRTLNLLFCYFGSFLNYYIYNELLRLICIFFLIWAAPPLCTVWQKLIFLQSIRSKNLKIFWPFLYFLIHQFCVGNCKNLNSKTQYQLKQIFFPKKYNYN